MKFSGGFNRNFSSANGSKNLDYKKDIILDEVAKLIELNRGTVLSTLKDAGYYNISPTVSKKELINLVTDALYSSEQFRHDVAALIANSGGNYSNAFGDKIKGWFSGGSDSGSSGGGSASGAATDAHKSVSLSADPIGAIAGALGSIFGSVSAYGTSKQDRKAEEERTKQQLYDKLLADKKTNWTPIIVIGGILIIGGIVTFFALRGRNKNVATA